jgi:UrcA family protein
MISATIKQASLRSRSTHRSVLLAAAITLLGGLSAVHAATPSEEALSVAVHFGDLNPATPDGSLRLYARIVQAAQQVCPAPSKDLAMVSLVKKCQADAIAKAVSQVNSPQLAVVYATRIQHG